MAEWRETLGPDYESFCGRHHAATEIKLQVMAVGYLLHRIDDLHAVAKFSQLTFVKQVFNAQAVDASIERVRQELQRWGYGKRRTIGQLPSTLSESCSQRAALTLRTFDLRHCNTSIAVTSLSRPGRRRDGVARLIQLRHNTFSTSSTPDNS